jgi:iron-sulfur cluster repair protein YtfE (RIC family)
MPTRNRTDSVTDYLQGDHRRLDALMERCRGLVQAGNVAEAASVFAEFREGLLRHIRIEEELLFPEFEQATGLERTSGPTGVMHSEHLEIQRLLDDLRGMFESKPPAAQEFEPIRSALVALLSEHNAKEERILYPMSDQMVPAGRLETLIDRMKSY